MSVKIEDFHIGFEYEEYQMDSNRYLNKGGIWVKKIYGFNSPRLYKVAQLIKQGKIRSSMYIEPNLTMENIAVAL